MKKLNHITSLSTSSVTAIVISYIKTDYYCRASINFIIAMCFCSTFFAVFFLFGNDPRLFLLPIIVTMVIGCAFFILLFGRVIMMIHRVCSGVVVEAEIKKIMLFGHVFYDFKKAIDIVNEFAKKGLEASIRIKAVQVQYYNIGQPNTKTCYFYNQRYTDMTPIVKEQVLVLIGKDSSNRFLVFPELLGLISDNYGF